MCDLVDAMSLFRSRSSSETRLVIDAGFDSVMILEFVAHLERAFSVEISTEDVTAEDFATVGRVVQYIEARRSQADDPLSPTP